MKMLFQFGSANCIWFGGSAALPIPIFNKKIASEFRMKLVFNHNTGRDSVFPCTFFLLCNGWVTNKYFLDTSETLRIFTAAHRTHRLATRFTYPFWKKRRKIFSRTTIKYFFLIKFQQWKEPTYSFHTFPFSVSLFSFRFYLISRDLFI